MFKLLWQSSGFHGQSFLILLSKAGRIFLGASLSFWG